MYCPKNNFIHDIQKGREHTCVFISGTSINFVKWDLKKIERKMFVKSV